MKFDRREKHLIAQIIAYRLLQITNPPYKKAVEDLYKKVCQWENEKDDEELPSSVGEGWLNKKVEE